MSAKSGKYTIIFILLISIMFIMTACDLFSDNLHDQQQENVLGLKVSINQPDSLELQSGNAEVMTIEENLEIRQAVVEIRDNQAGEIVAEDSMDWLTHTGEAGEEGQDFVFSDLTSGEQYYMQVKLTGVLYPGTEDETWPQPLYQGETITEKLPAGKVVEETVTARPLNAQSLKVDVEDEEGTRLEESQIEEIKLYHPTLEENDNYTESVNLEKNSLPVEFDNQNLDLVPAHWHLKVELSDGELEPDYGEVLLLPDEEKSVTLVISKGQVSVEITKHTSLEAPADLKIENEKFTWQEVEGADSYVVYRTDSDQPEGIRAPAEIITAQPTVELEQLPKRGYYWVRAYDEAGLSGELSTGLNLAVVNSEQDQTYSTVQQAVDGAEAGDKIILLPGVYEPFTVEVDGLNIEGPNVGVDAQKSRRAEAKIAGQIIINSAQNITLNGLYVDATGCSAAVEFSDASYIDIENNIIKNAQSRGLSGDINYLTVVGNLFYSTGEAGIDNIDSESNLDIRDNHFAGISRGAGIVMGSDVDDTYVAIDDNYFENNYRHLQSDTSFAAEGDLHPETIIQENEFAADVETDYAQEPEWVIVDQN